MTVQSKLIFYLVRLPLILGLMMTGFVMEFLIELPFRAIMRLHPRTRGSAGRNAKKESI